MARERKRAGEAKGRFGRRKSEPEPPREPVEMGSGAGPYDIGDLPEHTDLSNSHLDLGSVLVPVVEGGQVTVEMSAEHQPQTVYLVTPHGRISVSAYAAPRTPGQWREVVGELAESLREEDADTSIEMGFWGREVVATFGGGQHRFIGVDGPRWMVRAVISAPVETAEQLTPVARAVVSETVVRRGDEPHPPRTPLPILLPPVLAEQVAAAQQQMLDNPELAEQYAEQGYGAPHPSEPEPIDPVGDFVDPGNAFEGGARAQEATATVFEEGRDAPIAAEPEPVEEPPTTPSQGSAMQQLRQQRGR